MLERIVYISIAAEPMTDDSVSAILDVSRARNGQQGVSGLLIGGNGWWMQVLEGEPDNMAPIWTSIRNDPRHQSIVLVQQRSIGRRDFARWSMKYRKETGDFEDALQQLTEPVSDPRLRAQLTRFGDTFLRQERLGPIAANWS